MTASRPLPPFSPQCLDPRHAPVTFEVVDLQTRVAAPLSLVGYRLQAKRRYALRVRSRTGSVDGWADRLAVVDKPTFFEELDNQTIDNDMLQMTFRIERPTLTLRSLARVETLGELRLRLRFTDGRDPVELQIPMLVTGYHWQLVSIGGIGLFPLLADVGVVDPSGVLHTAAVASAAIGLSILGYWLMKTLRLAQRASRTVRESAGEPIV